MDEREKKRMLAGPLLIRQIGMTTLLFTLPFVLSVSPLLQQAAFGSTVADVVTYREWPEGGSYGEHGRTLKAEEHARYGIDINSHVDIEVDSALLKQRLTDKVPGGLSERALKVQARIRQLEEVSRQIDGTIVMLQLAFSDFDKAKSDPRLWDQAKGSIRKFSDQMLSIITTLKKAIGLRLEAEGIVKDEQEKKKIVNERILPIYIPSGGYDWKELVKLYQQELAALDRELEKLIPDLDKLQMEIQGQIFRTGGSRGEPIHLPRYNEVKECIPTPVQKVTFNVPGDQLELFKEYSETVKTMQDAKSVAEAMRIQLAADAKRLRVLLEQSFESAGAAVREAKQSVEALQFWADQENASGWLKAANTKIGGSQEGKKIIAEYEKIQSGLTGLYLQARYDIDVMARYAELRSTIAGQAPEEAMITIMKEINAISYQVIQARRTGKPELLLPEALRPSTWLARKEDIEKLIKSVKDSAPAMAAQLETVKFKERNPFQDARLMSEAFGRMVDEVSKVSPEIPVWLAQVLQLPPVIAASEMERPAGQERFSILKEDLSTSFDLQTICGQRSEYDQVRVSYIFYNNNVELDSGWHNDFQLRKYGWKDNFVASVSFVKQRSTNTFKPTASISWILDYTTWPGKNKDGTFEKGVGWKNDIEWFSGGGLTTMALDLDPNQDTELGLGLTLSFLNNRILVGYGWDLQSRQQKNFVFFSINLFKTSGMIPSNGAQK